MEFIYKMNYLQQIKVYMRPKSYPASVAQLDARLTGGQEVAGSAAAEFGNILSWRLIMKYFLRHSLSSSDSRRAVVSFWRKNVHNTG